MKRKIYKTKGKTYLIAYTGIVYDENGKETKDIVIRDNHYYLKSKPVHRIVYNLFKGEIPKGFACHHINLCGLDNRISNLILIPKDEHRRLHQHISHHKEFKQYLKSKAKAHYYKVKHTTTLRYIKK